MALGDKSVVVTSPYTYASLHNASTHIRLLHLEPANWNDSIRCTIREYELESAPPFGAISYSWGSPAPLEHILLNGNCGFAVRVNCALAFRQYRHNAEHPVWIDSVYIAQNDKDEKGEQIQIMGMIFSRADFIVACIGPHKDDSEFVVAAIQNKTYHADDGGAMERLGRAYAAFGLRRYWNRLWIVQEIRLARDVYITCGSDVVCTSDALFRWNSRSPVNYQSWRERAAYLQHLLPVDLYPRMQSLLDNVRLHKDLKCTEVRDHVFGLIGISREFRGYAPIATLRVNYGGSPVPLLRDVIAVSGDLPHTIPKLEKVVADLFEDFVQANPILRMPTRDKFCTDFLQCIAASSPASAFVYIIDTEGKDPDRKRSLESEVPNRGDQTWARYMEWCQQSKSEREREEREKKSLDRRTSYEKLLEWQQNQISREKEEQEKRKMEDHYEQERQKHENRLQRARELSGTFLLL